MGIALLVCLGSLPLGLAEEIKGRLSIDYKSPTISVEARGASLVQVLKKIGEDLGFVVESRGFSPVIPRFAVKGAALETALRQLLASENYAIFYAGQRIERIVLLRPTAHSKSALNPQKSPGDKRASPNVTRAEQTLARSFDPVSGEPKPTPAVAREEVAVRVKVSPPQSLTGAKRRAPTASNAHTGSVPTTSSNAISVPAGLQHHAMQRVRNLADALAQATQDLQNTGPGQ